VLLLYLTSGKRSNPQRSMPASTRLALRYHVRLIYSQGMQWAKMLPFFGWIRFIFPQHHLRWKRALTPLTRKGRVRE